MRYIIEVVTDNPDGDDIIRDAARKIACELDWGGENTTRIEVTGDGIGWDTTPRYLAGYEMEPGEETAGGGVE